MSTSSTPADQDHPGSHDAGAKAAGRTRHRLVAAAVLVSGAIAFSTIFDAHLRRISEARYANRDDAVITLSHARNLVEYGFIGVSPSGERVEGFSAPLQFLIAAAIYSVCPFDYRTFFQWQTRIGTLVLGAVFGLLLIWSPDLSTAQHRRVFAIVALLASAQILATSSAFLWWHASGMENVYKSVALVALLWAFDGMLRERRIWWPAAALVAVAAISRIDAVVPVAVLLGAFVVLWWRRHHDLGALALAAAGLAPWIAFMTWRHEYFGEWAPNTAAAQAITVGGRLAAAVRLPVNALLDYRAWFNDVGASLHGFQLLWLIPLGWFLRRHPTALSRVVLITAGTAACVIQYALFGQARMDPARTVTELALFATAAVPFVLLGCRPFTRAHLLFGVAALASSVALTINAAPHRPEIGWGTSGFEAVAEKLEGIAAVQDIPRPMIANPDLGAVSWRKHFNVVDVGRLGSAVIPRVALPSAYIAAVAQPDIVELHAPWSCFYQDLFRTAAFTTDYVRLTPPPVHDAECPGPTGSTPAYWLRRAIMKDSASPERRFLDRFRETLAIDLVAQELARCSVQPGARPCAYVGRTLFRFVPELTRSGRDQQIAALLARDPRLRVEHAFFTSSRDPRWWVAIESAGTEPLHLADAGTRP